MGASTSFSASTESKERMSTKYANARTIFAVACGLAVCCSVMYITADGEQLETVHAAAAPVFNSPGPKSVQSTDVQEGGAGRYSRCECRFCCTSGVRAQGAQDLYGSCPQEVQPEVHQGLQQARQGPCPLRPGPRWCRECHERRP